MIIWSKSERLRCQIQDMEMQDLNTNTSMEMQDLNTNLDVCHSQWLCTVNHQRTVLMHFETILKNAERLGYGIQDILYGNASLEQECESFEGVWVNLAFYRESDTAGTKTSVSIYKWMNVFIHFVWDYQVKNNTLCVENVTDSDKLALWLHAFFYFICS